MLIAQYINEYTSGKKVTLFRVFDEVRELFEEIIKLNFKNAHEEFEDVVHFLQLWMYWRFGLNQEIWSMSRHSVKKFMDRKAVWQDIYEHVGLPRNISGYVGNYQKEEKVIKHLGELGVEKERAKSAYRDIVKPRLINT